MKEGTKLFSAGEDGEEDDEISDTERAAQKQSAEDNLLARYRTEWPWWDDLHALWCERPNFNPPGVQNSRTQFSPPLDDFSIDINLDPNLSQSTNGSIVDLTQAMNNDTPDLTQSPDSVLSESPAPSQPRRISSTSIKTKYQPSAKRRKVDPLDKLKSSVKEISEMETTKLKEEYAYKRYKLELQDKDAQRQLEEKKLQTHIEEKRVRYDAQLKLYEYQFQQWLENNLSKEPPMPRFD